MSSDPVNNPQHYKSLKPEPIEVIEAWGLGFCLGNTVKYISRAGKKGSRVEDLKKAAWYLAREIEQVGGSSVAAVPAVDPVPKKPKPPALRPLPGSDSALVDKALQVAKLLATSGP